VVDIDFTDELEGITPDELAALWHVNSKTIYREIERGRLHCLRVGRSIRFTREQVREYVEANSV
jgi:excisionase family DNA binding protein